MHDKMQHPRLGTEGAVAVDRKSTKQSTTSSVPIPASVESLPAANGLPPVAPDADLADGRTTLANALAELVAILPGLPKYP